jgi:ribosomal protein S19
MPAKFFFTHNGIIYKKIKVDVKMVEHAFGEFARTKKNGGVQKKK